MKKLICFSLLIIGLVAGADVKIGDLPLGSASTTGANDSFPYVDFFTNVTRRVKLSDLINLPTMGSTYAKLIGSPTFTGTVTAGSGFVGNLSGNVVGNLTGNVTGNVSGSSGSFTGMLAGDVTGTQSVTLITSLARSKFAYGSPFRLVINGTTGVMVDLYGITAARALISNSDGLPVHSTTTAAQVGYLDTLSSNVQSQLDSKQAAGDFITDLSGDVVANGPGAVSATITDLLRSKIAPGSGSRIVVNGTTGYLDDNPALAPFRIVLSNTTGLLESSVVTTTEASYLSSVNAPIQGQLNAKLTSSLVNSHIFVGNVSNVASDVAVTGDIALNNLGVTSYFGIVPVVKGGTGLIAGTSGGILGFTGSTTLASSGVLGANNLLLGGGAGATPSSLGSLGTATTVLHGNVSGAPSFAAVSLTADVSGTLPTGNGGRGIETQETPSGTVNSSNVTFTLANTPVTNASLKVYLDGTLQENPAHYSVSTTTITFVTAPSTGQRVYATYSR